MAETLRCLAASVISRVVVEWTPRVANRRSASRSRRARVSVPSRGMQRQERRDRQDLYVDLGHGLSEGGERRLGLLAIARRRVHAVLVVLGDDLVAKQLEHLEDLLVGHALAGKSEHQLVAAHVLVRGDL